MMDIAIKELFSNEEYFEVIELQKIIWRLQNYDDCIPNHIFKAVSEIGGLVFGAYAQNRLIGFLMAMVGQENCGVFHHSHILGVHPDFVHKHIGFLLKKAHYEKAKLAGINKITWTYDPLQGANANLNISKLGSIVRIYKVNHYGEAMGGSGLVSGLPSDRFWIEWYIQTEHVKNRMEGLRTKITLEEYQLINRVEMENKGWQKIKSFSEPESNKIAIEIPSNFQAIYDHDKKLAVDWRLQTRQLFVDCFKKSYTVTDFLHQERERNFYLLEKNCQIK